MSRSPADDAAPTMIIPRGLRIEIDPDGQLSIHAPGNLVVQNSGKYGMLESLGGSIRIERGVEVEAITVRCPETCYVQGFLTAWKVNARSLQLEESARAHVVLQETEHLEIGRDARMVGNFSSEKELVGLFSRFANQVRSLPFRFEKRAAPAELPEGRPPEKVVRGAQFPPPPPEPSPAELPEPLLFALVLLEREFERQIHPGASQRALSELMKLLQEQDLETLDLTYKTLFGRIAEPREDARHAHDLIRQHFSGEVAVG
ncbi:MAG TPA: hypothetical protein VGX68_11455 [Thermoanaerobaculia bacterium]|jgi:hypothetical protein|nr:hypothetical protein [Thermoanaerobaculia bacterium]